MAHKTIQFNFFYFMAIFYPVEFRRKASISFFVEKVFTLKFVGSIKKKDYFWS